jgi:hypothetical protein
MLPFLQGWTLSTGRFAQSKPKLRVLLAIDILIPGIATVIDNSECMYACLYLARYSILLDSYASA